MSGAYPDPSRIEFILENKESDSRRLRRACVMCARSHLGCDGKRPCKRCIQKGYPQLCKDNDATSSRKKKKPKRPIQNSPSDDEYIPESEKPIVSTPIISNYPDSASQIRTFNVPTLPLIRTKSPPPSLILPQPIITPPVGPTSSAAASLPYHHQAPSQHSIHFLLDHNNTEKTTEDLFHRLVSMEDCLRREMKSMREEIKQTHIQQSQIISTLSNLQKQLAGLFLIRSNHACTVSMHNLIEDTPKAVWDLKTLRLLQNNTAFEKLVTIGNDPSKESFYFWELFPEFFKPVADNLVQSILNTREEGKLMINQVIALCPSHIQPQVIYVNFRGYTQCQQDKDMEFVTLFSPINSNIL